MWVINLYELQKIDQYTFFINNIYNLTTDADHV